MQSLPKHKRPSQECITGTREKCEHLEAGSWKGVFLRQVVTFTKQIADFQEAKQVENFQALRPLLFVSLNQRMSALATLWGALRH